MMDEDRFHLGNFCQSPMADQKRWNRFLLDSSFFYVVVACLLRPLLPLLPAVETHALQKLVFLNAIPGEQNQRGGGAILRKNLLLAPVFTA